MTDAPERIWADLVNNDGGVWWRKGIMPDGTEYVRADLVAAAYRQGVEDAAKVAMRYHYKALERCGVSDDPSHEECASTSVSIAAAIRTLEYKPEGTG